MKKIHRYIVFTIVPYFVQISTASAACFNENNRIWQSFKTLVCTCLVIISFTVNLFVLAYEYIMHNITPPIPTEETNIAQDKEVTLGSKINAQDCIGRTERYAVKYCNARNGQMNETNIETDYDRIRYNMKYCCKHYLFYVNSVNILRQYDIAFYEDGSCCTNNCTLVRNNSIQKEYNK